MPAAKRHYAAVDLGAETGRIVVGAVDDGGIELLEVQRFPNRPVRTPDGLHWDLLGIFADLLAGLERASATAQTALVSAGVDSWGVDYALVDNGGRLLGNPYHYRDARTDGETERYALHVSPQRQYELTGIAQMPINTLYQLAAHARAERTLELAHTLLMIPDIMHYWLCGTPAVEFTNASTTGMLGVDGRWAGELLAPIGVPQRILTDPLDAGTTLGTTRSELGLASRGQALRVVVPATHDTACAVLAAPLHVAAPGQTCAFISSGTWSLLGVELARPVVSEAARCAGFTNERGVAGSVRFLRNIMGLWLVQECRRAWGRAGTHYAYDELTARAATIASPGLVIDVDDPILLHPADMTVTIGAQLIGSGQRAADDPVVLTRAIFEGLALQYRRSIADAERLAGVRVGAIAIVGGGARNALLCQLAADACERVVAVGPAEASATGNILIQAAADRGVREMGEMRAFAQTTARPRTFEPQRAPAIDWAARTAAIDARRRSESVRPDTAPAGAHADPQLQRLPHV